MNLIRDALSGLSVFLDALHHLVHLGKLYNLHADSVDASFDTGTYLDVLIVTGARPVHSFFEFSAFGGRSEVTIVEGVTATPGAAVAANNNNREPPSDASVLFSVTQPPSAISGGAAIFRKQLFASAQASSKGTVSLRTGEIVLARNTKYLVRQTAAADNMLAATDLELYER